MKHDKKLKLINRRKQSHKGMISKLPRVVVHRTNKHIYVQVVDSVNGKTLLSSGDVEIANTLKVKKTKTQISTLVGEDLAKKAKTKKIVAVTFDRGRFRYHGRVKALAEALREGGMKL
ncbi:50S ribosomal protein L18 [Candidatus Woesebacteria bacterium]|nr:MAG: 50S ribosomal protein L18 [Candidatus Woesebacteria bacterium]